MLSVGACQGASVLRSRPGQLLDGLNAELAAAEAALWQERAARHDAERSATAAREEASAAVRTCSRTATYTDLRVVASCESCSTSAQSLSRPRKLHALS